MSFGIPIAYNQLENSLAIPSQLVGDDLKSFGKGARNNVRSVPTSSGSVGASSTLLFNLPVGGYDYIKSNSMYLKCSIRIQGAHAANTNAGTITFNGNSSVNGYEVGGASSLINRVNVMVGGTSLSYPNYQHFRNSVMPHIVGFDFLSGDLRQLEYSSVDFPTGSVSGAAVDFTIDVAIPLWLPCFNSNQAFPALLISTPITVEILTETIANSFALVETTITGYTVADASLVYETITVSSEFKQALLQSKAGQMYNIKLNDWMSIGPTASTGKMTYQIGCGLSSLRAVCWTEFLNNAYNFNGLTDYKVSVNNLQISVNNPDNDAVTFAEMNRALSRLNDYNVSSVLGPVANTANSGIRNTYTSSNFLGGASCDVFSDYGYDQTGVPASTVTLELSHDGGTARKWQSTAAHNPAASLYVYLLHDSTLSVDVSSGVVMIRK
jgi:hypothetical protein